VEKMSIFFIIFFLFSSSRWELIHYEVTDNGFLDISAPDSLYAWLVGIRDNVGGIIYRTQDGGNSWEEIHPWDVEEAFFTHSVQFLDHNTGYVTSIGIIWNIFPVACILKTTDGGYNWETVYGGDISFINRLWEDVYFVDYNNGWVVGYKGDILRTSDGGNNWFSQQSPDTAFSLKAVYFIDQNQGWIAGGEYDTLTGEGKDGVILYTSDGGNTWEVQVENAPFQLWDVFFINSQKGWVCGYKDSTSPGITLKTEDGGNSWDTVMTPEVSLGPYGIYGIEFIDENTGFAAGAGRRWNTSNSYFAVFLRTDNGGNSWSVDTVIYTNEPWGVSPVCIDMVSKNWGFAGGTRLSVFRFFPSVDITENKEYYDKFMNVSFFENRISYSTDKNFKLKIIDVRGRVIYKKEIMKEKIDITPGGSGIYYILLNSRKTLTKGKVILFK
jgi:photosystem II stability/assembly factor-like uncharacterized protein